MIYILVCNSLLIWWWLCNPIVLDHTWKHEMQPENLHSVRSVAYNCYIRGVTRAKHLVSSCPDVTKCSNMLETTLPTNPREICAQVDTEEMTPCVQRIGLELSVLGQGLGSRLGYSWPLGLQGLSYTSMWISVAARKFLAREISVPCRVRKVRTTKEGWDLGTKSECHGPTWQIQGRPRLAKTRVHLTHSLI